MTSGMAENGLLLDSARVADAADTASLPAVRATGLSKRFRLYERPLDRLIDAFWPREGRATEVAAISDVSFTVNRGECFGIVGVNGSGKSTLLKLLSGTLLPSAGTVELRGRVLALLELGGGINPELTGRQNVATSAAMLGFPESYAEERMAQIEEFADIGAFFDRPMKIYSSGMYVRLAFSIYLFMEPEILIVDEALSVGDVFFQQKCFDAIRAIIKRGTTVIFVSHDAGAVQSLCNRSLVLEHGRVTFIGRPDEAINRYHTSFNRRLPESAEPLVPAPVRPAAEDPARLIEKILANDVLGGRQIASAAGHLRVIAARTAAPGGDAAVVVKCGEALHFEFVLEATASVAEPDLELRIYDRFRRLVFGTSTTRAGEKLPPMAAGERVAVSLSLGCRIAVGQYTYQVAARETAEETAPAMQDAVMLGPVVVHWDRTTSLFYGVGGPPCSASPA